MTSEEVQMLGGLVERVQQTRLTEKDPDADQMINRGMGRNPDALYILAQTVLVQNIALEQAQSQLRQLQQQRLQAPPARATSFLGSLLGHHDPPPPPVQNYPPPGYNNPGYGAASPFSGPTAGAMSGGMSGAGGFLRSAATTAAGVAAGALAFEGIESLLHGGGYGGGFGSSMGMGGRPAEETVINNYYEEPAGGREGHHEQSASFDDHGDAPRLEHADYETHGHDGSGGLDTSGIDSDLDDSVFNDPGDSSDFSGGDDSGLV